MADRGGVSKKDSHIHGSESFPVAVYRVSDIPGRTVVGKGGEFVNLPLHWHLEAEIFYMEEGACRYYIDGVGYELGAGEAIFVRPGALHWAKLEDVERAVSVSVTFHPDFLSGVTNDITASVYLPAIFEGGAGQGQVFSRKIAWQSEIIDDFLRIVELFDVPEEGDGDERHTDVTLKLKGENDGSELRIKSLFLDIFYLMTKNSASRRAGKGGSRSAYKCLLDSIDYLHAHYNEKLTLSTLAAKALMSEGHYSRVFSKYMGESPFSYLNSYRINRSIWFLVNTDMKIIDVAPECGFPNVSYYNRRFSEIMHCTPTEYRRENSGERYVSADENDFKDD